jgi:hypothetical protein
MCKEKRNLMIDPIFHAAGLQLQTGIRRSAHPYPWVMFHSQTVRKNLGGKTWLVNLARKLSDWTNL